MPLGKTNTRMLTGVEYDRWEGTYTTVNTNSATWATGGTGGGGLSGISYNRWAFTGSPPTSSFSISGANSEDSEAYRVTVDAVIQDSIKYTIDKDADTITFTQAPALSTSIVVIESYATASVGSGSSTGGSASPDDANLIIGLSLFL